MRYPSTKVLKMTGSLLDITLNPIGIVRNKVKQKPEAGYDWQKILSEIVVDSSLTEALDGLEDFSHILVLYWMHEVDRGASLPCKTHPRDKPELPLVGRFATRSPSRPNPIGKTTVRLLERQGNILKVKGLDAIDGTPVLDIKPYVPRSDSVNDARVPPWITQP
jgi:tRNA-Thr(GGU) m(6)t(6)A37 methyltransferase TsaA